MALGLASGCRRCGAVALAHRVPLAYQAAARPGCR